MGCPSNGRRTGGARRLRGCERPRQGSRPDDCLRAWARGKARSGSVVPLSRLPLPSPRCRCGSRRATCRPLRGAARRAQAAHHVEVGAALPAAKPGAGPQRSDEAALAPAGRAGRSSIWHARLRSRKRSRLAAAARVVHDVLLSIGRRERGFPAGSDVPGGNGRAWRSRAVVQVTSATPGLGRERFRMEVREREIVQWCAHPVRNRPADGSPPAQMPRSTGHCAWRRDQDRGKPLTEIQHQACRA